MSPEKLRKLAHLELETSTVNIISVRNEAMSRLTDIQDILNYFELAQKQPRSISMFEENSSSRTGDITDNLNSVRN